MTFSVQELADRVAGQVEGDPSQLISGVAPVLSAGPQELTYVMGARYLRHLTDSQAAAVLVGTDVEVSPNGKTFIRVEQPELAFSTLLDVFYPAPEIVDGVHPTAVVGSGVTIGRGVHVGEYAVIADRVTLGARTSVGAHTYVGRGVSIGEDCRLDPGCSVMEGAMIGDRVRIRCGARISSDGFGFTDGPTGAVKLKQVGKCVIGDDVEIGANTTVDRGALDDTVVGAGTKIDNLVQIGHNCRIGRHCFIVAQTGIAGSTILGDAVRVGGKVGIGGHLTIGDGATIGAASGVISNIPAGETWTGLPARPHREWLRASLGFYKLPEVLRRLSALEGAAEDTDGGEA